MSQGFFCNTRLKQKTCHFVGLASYLRFHPGCLTVNFHLRPRFIPSSGFVIRGSPRAWRPVVRRHTGWPVIVHWQVGGAVDVDGSHGHSDDSYHLAVNGYMATDFHFETRASIRVQFNALLYGGFHTGIGYYPHWAYSGKNCPGWHVDLRPPKKTQFWERRRDGSYVYFL